MKDAIGICYLVECGWTLRAVATTRAWMLGVAFELLYLASGFVDVGQQAAR